MQMNRKSTLGAFFLLLTLCSASACTNQGTDTNVEKLSNSSSPTVTSPVEPAKAPSPSKRTDSKPSAPAKEAPQTTANSVKTAKNQVKVFFPKNPETAKDFTEVEPVLRTTESKSVARFAIEQLVAGPRPPEQQKGLVKAIKLRGNSNCGSDFTISINKKVAQLKFCKDVVSAGIGDDVRTKSSIEATLKQFSTVKEVVLLNKQGKCLADLSGDNLCLKKIPK